MIAAIRYGVPLVLLSVVAVSFLRHKHRRPLGRRTQLVLAAVAAAPLVASGTLHLLRPGIFLPLLPASLPARRLLIVLTGFPELAGALGLFLPRFRRPASLWLAVFMVVIFPANIHVAGQTISGLSMPSVPVRGAMQAGYIVLLLAVGYGLPKMARD